MANERVERHLHKFSDMLRHNAVPSEDCTEVIEALRAVISVEDLIRVVHVVGNFSGDSEYAIFKEKILALWKEFTIEDLECLRDVVSGDLYIKLTERFDKLIDQKSNEDGIA